MCSKSSGWCSTRTSPPLSLIQGLRLFPWVVQYRANQVDDEIAYGETWADCSRCILDEQQRASARCGWVARSKHSQGRPLTPPDYPYEYPEVCSGYLVQLPQVIEAARARSWRKDGALNQFYEQPLTPLAKNAIDIIDGEFRAVEQHELRRNRRSE